jgi:hypothetical protein
MRPHTQRLAAMCSDAAEKAADGESFVPVKKLVEFLGAELRAQPLLYEGMVAEPKAKDAKWVILVNSLSSGYEPEKYEHESRTNALPPRVRFTIAHELGHVLQLRLPETPLRRVRSKKTKVLAAVEREFEQEADLLSPLLLIPDGGFARLCADGQDQLNLARLVAAKNHWAVSRAVIVNRLGILTRFDPKGFRFKPAMKDIAIGVAVWSAKGMSRVAKWPRPFCNFSQNLVPEFLQIERANEFLNSVFESPDFFLNGGDRSADEADVFLGTAANPQSEKIRVRLTVEMTRRSVGSRFLYVVNQV